MKAKNLIGERFGRLLVLKRDETKKGGAAYWICQCDCGNIKSIRGSNLTAQNNPTRSCGCLAKEINHQKIDITSQIGKTYGRLTVLERDMSKPIGHHKPSYWICQCECGNKVSVSLTQLKSGKTKSCGCLHSEKLTEMNTIDITGKKFGMLTAIRRTEQKSNKKDWLWECRCDCGNTKLVATNLLTSFKVQSCGCLKSSYGEYFIEQLLLNNNISFVKEFSFKDLKSNKNCLLRFDFAILDDNNNPIRLIEFDGEQHYNPESRYYTEQLVLNDRLKDEYCKNNHIPLVRIPYNKINTITLKDLLEDEYLTWKYYF